MRYYILISILLLARICLSQEVRNIHFEQNGKVINIYYDLNSEGNYKVRVFCSEDNGNTWGAPLKSVKGNIGENQKRGSNKLITWDVLKERDELSGNIQFKIEAILISFIGTSGTFIDERDAQEYKWIKKGSKIWMAENLKYDTKDRNSKCYQKQVINCDIYGRLYNWKTAKIVCPTGWHLPSNNDWDLYKQNAGTMQGSPSQTMAGMHIPGAGYQHIRQVGYWWTSDSRSGNNYWARYCSWADCFLSRKSYPRSNSFSVRCTKD